MTKLDAISKTHPLDPKAFIVDDCSVHCTPSGGNNEIHINSMDSHIKGAGTRALSIICNLADECGISLTLLAFGYLKAPKTDKLVEWYSRFGFKAGMGNKKDGWRMRRDPMITVEPAPQPIKLRGFDRLH